MKTGQQHFSLTDRSGGRFNLSFGIVHDSRRISPEKLLSDLLKRQSRRLMGDITECPSVALPAHLARLDDLRETIDFAVRHDLVPSDESQRSGKQLLYAHTLGDLRACLDITRREHRAPAFVNDRDGSLAQLNHKMDLLAGLVASALSRPTPEIFTNQDGENER